MQVTRSTYRKASVRNGATVVPLDLLTGIVEGATPALAYRIALGDAQCPGRQWEQQLIASHRRPPSRSTLERIAKKVGSAIKAASPSILRVVRAAEELNDDAHAISMGLDRTTIPMEEPLRKGDIRDPGLERRKKPYVRRAPEPVEVNYRMGYVGTVSVNDRDGECLQTYKYACSADEDPELVVQKMLDDVAHLRGLRAASGEPPLPIAIVQDGAPEMWRLVENGLRRTLPRVRYHKAIDRYHLTERLAESLKLLRMPVELREKLLDTWRRRLEEDDGAIDVIESQLRREIAKRKGCRMSAADMAQLQGHRTYIRNNKRYMRYATLRRKGLPTGSGATEGACKSVIMTRAKGCGQRWHSPGVNSVLTLRALYFSDRLRPAWEAFQHSRQRHIQVAA